MCVAYYSTYKSYLYKNTAQKYRQAIGSQLNAKPIKKLPGTLRQTNKLEEKNRTQRTAFTEK